jgi:hypothetical protein
MDSQSFSKTPKFFWIAVCLGILCCILIIFLVLSFTVWNCVGDKSKTANTDLIKRKQGKETKKETRAEKESEDKKLPDYYIHEILKLPVSIIPGDLTLISSMISTSGLKKFDIKNVSRPNSNINKIIDEIVFINMDRSVDRLPNITSEIEKICESSIEVFRLPGIPRKEGALGCLLSHLVAVSKAILNDANVLILEDDFMFKDSYEELDLKIKDVLETFQKDRWDVIVFGQYVKKWSHVETDGKVHPTIMKIENSTTTSGYLVNKNYARTFFNFLLLKVVPLLEKDKFVHEDHIDQMQTNIQTNHVWLGFKSGTIGEQRPGKSIIGNVDANNSWNISNDGKSWIDGNNKQHSISIGIPFCIKKIAVCCVATGKYKDFVKNIHTDMYNKFGRGHEITFFVFTDAKKDEVTYFKNTIVYNQERKGFPGDTLYRYHYMLKAKTELLKHDYVFYVDVDYRVMKYVELNDVISSGVLGLTATRHLFDIKGRNFSENHVGTPETNKKSSACIFENEKMKSYFCGGFQGGSSEEWVEMCTAISKNIDIDDMKNIMATWHDESHWNWYLCHNPPSKILSQSFMFDERCLDANNNSECCKSLKEAKVTPVMVPLFKNHKEFRSV